MPDGEDMEVDPDVEAQQSGGRHPAQDVRSSACPQTLTLRESLPAGGITCVQDRQLQKGHHMVVAREKGARHAGRTQI